MNNEVKVFNNETFGEVRTIVEGDEVWFVAKDVCNILGLDDVSHATDRLDGDEKLIRKLFVAGQNRNVLLVNESGLYTLVLRSNKPAAKQFRKWVTSEVLPSIRKHGLYAIEDIIANPDLGIKALQALKEERAARLEAEKTVELQKPKALYYDALVERNNSTSFRDTAKELNIPEKKFIQSLLNDKYIYRDQKRRLCAYAEHVKAGLFELKEWQAADKVGVQTLITVKGKDLFLSKYAHLQTQLEG